MAEPATELTAYDSAALIAAEEHGVPIVGRSPWYLAWRRLSRNYFALACLGVFLLIVIACALAPVYAHHVAHTGPNDVHAGETVMVNGHPEPVISGGSYYDAATGKFVIRDVKIIGPTWWHANGRFVLGADSLGRDVAVRLLYGGLNSLKIGIGSAFLCTIFAVLLALIGGFYGGWVDWIIARFFDLIWAFPVFLLAIALGSALSINGFHHFGINIEAGSLWIPTLVIAYVLIPYIGRPVRGQILSLREKEFIEAAVGQGARPWRIMLSDLLPNIASTVLVFFTLIIARFFDLIWAFPVFLLAIALGSALSINGFHHFGINIEAGSLWIPTLVIAYVLIPYIGRPVRGQILSLREKEFIEAAVGQGARPWRIMLSDLLPNIASTVLVFFTLIIASNILTETGLSFLGAGVRPPDPSWGNLIADGQDQLHTAPWLALIPGLAIVLTVLSLNIFGDGLRDALDPRAKVRIEH